MDVNESNLVQLFTYLQHTLSPDPNVRGPAEEYLESVEGTENYPVLLLTVVSKSDLFIFIRMAAAIQLKNYVKRNWNAHEEKKIPDQMHESDRVAIKSHIVKIMLESPDVLQKLLSDSVILIGKYDFTKNWPELIDEMVDKFATGDFNIINCVLTTANELLKRYRYEFKYQKLSEEIKFVLDRMAKPLTDLLLATMDLREVHKESVEALRIIHTSLLLICKVFLSLNSQELPEFFEDNLESWMNAFNDMLTCDVPLLQADEREEATVLDHVRTQVCKNLRLLAEKYEKEFGKYMSQFVLDVWQLLIKTGIETKYDSLVCKALQFLSVVADRNSYSQLFEDPMILTSICEEVIIPNIALTTSDEELFEDNPEEYIRHDIVRSDIDTRRRAACKLVKTLSRNFEAKIFEIFGKYSLISLIKYAENPEGNWKAKNATIHIVITLASKAGTQKHGVTETTEFVNVQQFGEQHILPELEYEDYEDVNDAPILKASVIKFIMVFRRILAGPFIIAAFPHLIRHLTVESVVVHSYAACTIEKALVLMDSANNVLINREALEPFANNLLEGLFATLTLPGSNENEYVMKAIMRSFSSLEETAIPYMLAALPRLTEILSEVAKNPSRPSFNHFLFETISLAIKVVCKAEPNAVNSFEKVLFPVFEEIIEEDVMEFMPYVLQLLALMLEIREGTESIPEPYWVLFPLLVTPILWERPGNVTPLTRLLCAFIREGSPRISDQDRLYPVLGVFQKMIASKKNDHEGFYLMQHLLTYYPIEELHRNMKRIFPILFRRLSNSKTEKYVRGMIVFFSYYSTKVGATKLVELVDSIKDKMFGMVIDRVFILDMENVSSEMDRKIVAIGISKILTECPKMLDVYLESWPRLLEALVELIELPPDDSTLEVDDSDSTLGVDDPREYQAAFSQLNFAQPKHQDFSEDMIDGRKFLVESLAKLSQSKPGKIPVLIAMMGDNHKMALQEYCAQAGVQIV